MLYLIKIMHKKRNKQCNVLTFTTYLMSGCFSVSSLLVCYIIKLQKKSKKYRYQAVKQKEQSKLKIQKTRL